MPRVKRGVTARAKHKKILSQAKGLEVEGRMFLELLNKLLLKLVNMPTEIDVEEKGILDLSGYQELMRLLEN